ncbi:hypothetical protein BT69DRAFT_1293601 [Atractiella rhizophila]|nr:hypothetical protein BT69DRAFT_1293601 [Atractiella rhizophila]
MDCYGLEAFKIGFNGNDLCHNVFPKAVKHWVMGENENVPLVLSYDPISDEFSTLMNSYIVNSAVHFMDGQFPVLLHPGEKRRCYEPYHVAWYRRQGTRGSLRTTYGDPMVWARSKNFFLTAVVPIEIYCRLSPRQFQAIIRRREKEGWQYDDSADHDLEKEAIDLCKRHSVFPHKSCIKVQGIDYELEVLQRWFNPGSFRNAIQAESLPPGCPGYNPTSVRNKILPTSLPPRRPGNRIPPTSLLPRRLGYNPACVTNRILAISLPPRHPSQPGWNPARDRSNNPVKMSCTGNVLCKTS